MSTGVSPCRNDARCAIAHPKSTSPGTQAITAKTPHRPRCEAVTASRHVACYFPSKAYRTPHGSDRGLTFNASQALNPDNPISLPCGRCNGCRQDLSDEWAIRCKHEQQMHEANGFITLTYADDKLPADYSVDRRPLQLFLKRLRKSLAGQIKFFAGAEYGPLDRRPHYHVIIFGWDFHADRKYFKTTDDGEKLYTSTQLSDAWQNQGFCTVGSVTFNSIKYCTGYIFDKEYNADKQTNHYTYTHPVTGDVVRQQPEFSAKSQGLGSTWFDKYKADCFPSDFLVVDNKQVAVPRYYRLKLNEQEEHARKLRAAFHPLKPDKNLRKKASKANSTPERLKVRKTIHDIKLKRRKHTL
jgi:hypothetical protein